MVAMAKFIGKMQKKSGSMKSGLDIMPLFVLDDLLRQCWNLKSKLSKIGFKNHFCHCKSSSDLEKNGLVKFSIEKILWSLSDEIITFKYYQVCPKSFQYEIWRFGLCALWKEIWQFQILHDSFCKNPQNYATRLRRQTNLQVWVC